MRREPGRPRNPAIDAAIALHTLRLLAQRGYRALTIADVAAAAGIAKPTLYRRYRNKHALVIAALSTMARNAPQPEDTGSFTRDLSTFARDTIHMMTDLNVFPLLSALIVRAAEDPRPLQLLRRYIILPRRAAVKNILALGKRRKQIRRYLNLDVATDALIGSVFTRYNGGLPLNERWLRTAITEFSKVWR